MILTLDIGNSQLFAGLFIDGKIELRFRKTSSRRQSSDEYGLFLKSVLRENGFDPNQVKHIVMGSVVPELNHSVSSACIKYFNLRPLVLQAGLKTGIKIKYRNPLEVGSDRIANSIAASVLYAEQNVIIVDFGTTTTICVLNAAKEYLGGSIAPGLRLSMETLEQNTAKLPTVEIKIPEVAIGKSTTECIQAGLYYSSLGMAKEIIQNTRQSLFAKQEVKVIATGGFANLFQKTGLFNEIQPDLVLLGLYEFLRLNTGRD